MQVLRRMHGAYVDVTSNPFHEAGQVPLDPFVINPSVRKSSSDVLTQLPVCTTTMPDEVFAWLQPLTSLCFDQKVKAILHSANGLAQPA